MAGVTSELIKQLRDKTGAGMMDCKRALEATEGDLARAEDWLRQKGISKAAERAGRTAGEGVIATYVHKATAEGSQWAGSVGVLVELNSESDFVARTEQFQNLARELALQVAGGSPLYVRRQDVPDDLVQREREVALSQAKEQGKEKFAEKMVEGKLNSFYGELCLLEQVYLKDTSKKVSDLLAEAVSSLKENIVVSRFVRFEVGQSPAGDGTTGEE
ncbi:MAG: translation elongation factor Ts [Candidatus Dormibacteraeota bacterium]|nr:translation elongation factor Ts [Candidatus Dormibacteraeota bacterium]